MKIDSALLRKPTLISLFSFVLAKHIFWFFLKKRKIKNKVLVKIYKNNLCDNCKTTNIIYLQEKIIIIYRINEMLK